MISLRCSEQTSSRVMLSHNCPSSPEQKFQAESGIFISCSPKPGRVAAFGGVALQPLQLKATLIQFLAISRSAVALLTLLGSKHLSQSKPLTPELGMLL